MLEQRLRFVGPVRPQRSTPEQVVELGIPFGRVREGREQLVGLRVVTITDELLSVGEIGIGGKRAGSAQAADCSKDSAPAMVAAHGSAMQLVQVLARLMDASDHRERDDQSPSLHVAGPQAFRSVHTTVRVNLSPPLIYIRRYPSVILRSTCRSF